MNNLLHILSGLFNFSSQGSASRKFVLVLSRFLWEAPQTLIGLLFALLMNAIGKVRRVEYFAGCTYVIEVNTSGVRRGVSLGNYVYVRLADDNAHFGTDPLLLHEYGHHLQSRQWGVLYLFVIGIPSLWSILSAVPLTDQLSTHDLKWYELQANRFAAMTRMKYFGKDWLEFEPPFRSFPTRRPVTLT